jgi:predicted metal-dependent HD superfamily phosphohydrolase
MYHNLTHIHALLRLMDSLPSAVRPQDRTALVFACWFHDAVYDGTQKDNEERSAAQWREFGVQAVLDTVLVGKVDDWIMQTKHHMQCPADAAPDKKLFLDLDLSILAAEPDVYEAYSKAIRSEYSHISSPDFRRGRAKVMQTFLAAERLYFTSTLRDLWETRARSNIKAEIEALQNSAE